jgi:hypothetical protein
MSLSRQEPVWRLSVGEPNAIWSAVAGGRRGKVERTWGPGFGLDGASMACMDACEVIWERDVG